MALDIKFSFICEKRFEDLKGEGNKARFCEKCQFQVFNLDPLTEEERLVLFEDASKNNKKICVSASLPLENKTFCSQSSQFPNSTLQPPSPPIRPMPTAGLPKMPSPEKLAQERARMEKEKIERLEKEKFQQAWWNKFKFW